MTKEEKKMSSKIILVLSLLVIIISVTMITHILQNSSDTNSGARVQCSHSNNNFVEKPTTPPKTKKPYAKDDDDNEDDDDDEFDQNLQKRIVELWNYNTDNHDFKGIKSILDKKLVSTGENRVSYVLAITKDAVVAVTAMKPGWKRSCHRHPVNFQAAILKGRFFVQTHEMKQPIIAKPGDKILIPKWQPHREGVAGNRVTYMIDTITPNVNPNNLTEMLDEAECSYHKLPPLNIPKIVTDEQPVLKLLPEAWTATVLLHPFSEGQGVGPEKDYPFFQLTYGKVTYNSEAQEMLIRVKGCTTTDEWWFKMTANNTMVSRDANTWREEDLGWRLPSRNWTDPEDVYVGHSILNWLSGEQRVDWWKKNYRNTSTWTWFDRNKGGLPFRLMFSAPPTSNFKGEEDNLAFFQMYALSYIVDFKPEFTKLEDLNVTDISGDIGLVCGNPGNFQMFNWTHHFSMSAFMIPVDYPHNPYPTQVYYHWKYDQNYTGNPFDRSQSTIFYNDYNRFERLETVRADLFGHWHDGKEKRNGTGFLMKTSLDDWSTTCDVMYDEGIAIAQQPPWWPTLGLAKIMAVIQKPEDANDDWKSPLTNSNRTIAIIRVTFPPHDPNFPNSTSLWTWYDYTDFIEGNGEARPVIFMQSAPNFSLGTSLAQADFFDFNVLSSDLHSRTKLDLENLQHYCNFS